MLLAVLLTSGVLAAGRVALPQSGTRPHPAHRAEVLKLDVGL
jgi:hypothetical protein